LLLILPCCDDEGDFDVVKVQVEDFEMFGVIANFIGFVT
jgi:hypothetical protein